MKQLKILLLSSMVFVFFVPSAYSMNEAAIKILKTETETLEKGRKINARN
jgi:hypothetical protein